VIPDGTEPLPEPRFVDPDDFDNCERCGKPLGSYKAVDEQNRVVCYGCEQEGGDE